MHIHEYQAKTLFNQFGIKTPEGVLISTVEQSSKACSELGGWHLGGKGSSSCRWTRQRGWGDFVSLDEGGGECIRKITRHTIDYTTD